MNPQKSPFLGWEVALKLLISRFVGGKRREANKKGTVPRGPHMTRETLLPLARQGLSKEYQERSGRGGWAKVERFPK